jgi:formylglycine-generating enzyme required for sulfatase activity
MQRRKLRDGGEVSDPHPLALKSQRDYLAEILPFFDKILDVLVHLHGAGVLHRDLKPSNILVDTKGLGWLTDFGLARSNHPDQADRSRKAMGTFGFMSPEQWSGEDGLDARADVFSMGVTIYQALLLEFPYGRGPINEATKPVRIPAKLSRSWPANLDLVIQKALEPDRSLRYRTATELRDDWQRVRKGQLPRHATVSAPRRLSHRARRWWIAATAVTTAGVAAMLAALLLIPPAKVVRSVRIATDPPGARLALLPLRDADSAPDMEKAIEASGKTPTTVYSVPPGDYLIVVEVPGHGFHEVFRRVPAPGEEKPQNMPRVQPWGTGRAAPQSPATEGFPHRSFEEIDGVVILPQITIPKYDVTAGMVEFVGREFTMGNANVNQGAHPPHRRTVESYFLDKTEVTCADYERVRKFLPDTLRDAHSPRDAVRYVNYDEAVRFAEAVGKRLPDEVEYEFAATNGGQNLYPWGDDLEKIAVWKYGAVGLASYDRTSGEPCVLGLYSNVAEWTSSRLAPYPGDEKVTPAPRRKWQQTRVVRGAPDVALYRDGMPPDRERRSNWTAFYRIGMDPDTGYPGIGFRCARSAKPRFPRVGRGPA